MPHGIIIGGHYPYVTERDKMEKPIWYITPSEYAGLIVDSLEDNNFFKRNQKYHPDDICSAIESISKCIALSLSFVGKTSNNNLTAKQIREKIKHALNQEDSDGVAMYLDAYDTWKATNQ